MPGYDKGKVLRAPCGPSAAGLKIAEGQAHATIYSGGTRRSVIVTSQRGPTPAGQIRPETLARLVRDGKADPLLTVRCEVAPGQVEQVTLDISEHPLESRNKKVGYSPHLVAEGQRDAYARICLHNVKLTARETSGYVRDVVADNLRRSARDRALPVDALMMSSALDLVLNYGKTATLDDGLSNAERVSRAAAWASDPAARRQEVARLLDSAGGALPGLREQAAHVRPVASGEGATILEASCTRCKTSLTLRTYDRDLVWWQGSDSGAAAAAVLGAYSSEPAALAFPYLTKEAHTLLDTGLCLSCHGGEIGHLEDEPAPDVPRRLSQVTAGIRESLEEAERRASELPQLIYAMSEAGGEQDRKAAYQLLKDHIRDMVSAIRFEKHTSGMGEAQGATIVGDITHHLAGPAGRLGMGAYLLDSALTKVEQGGEASVAERVSALLGAAEDLDERLRAYRETLESERSGTYLVGDAYELAMRHAGGGVPRSPRSVFPDDCQVEGSVFLLSRALWAAATNAGNAMKDAGVAEARFDVHAVRLGDRVVVTVSDNGPGMPPELQRKMREVGNTSAPGRGLGLGLGTISSVVELHGGRVVVAADPRAGTTLLLDLPAAKAARGDGAPQEERQSA